MYAGHNGSQRQLLDVLLCLCLLLLLLAACLASVANTSKAVYLGLIRQAVQQSRSQHAKMQLPLLLAQLLPLAVWHLLLLLLLLLLSATVTLAAVTTTKSSSNCCSCLCTRPEAPACKNSLLWQQPQPRLATLDTPKGMLSTVCCCCSRVICWWGVLHCWHGCSCAAAACARCLTAG
jgi:hypothetical protein